MSGRDDIVEPKVSVIMPCFNAVDSVARAVESIRTQTFESWELIVVDDGSVDGSVDVVERIAEADERIRLLRRPHEGVVGASNHGFSLAKSPFVARMDADDVSLPPRLERQLEMLGTRPDLGAVSCLTRFAGDVAAAGGYAHHVDWANGAVSGEQVALSRFIDLPVPHPTLMYRRETIERCGGYRDGFFPEDYEMILRWISLGTRIAKVDEVLYDWHDPPGRLSRNDSRYAAEAFHECKAPYLARAIADSGCAGRGLWIWGAGRPARKCARPLEAAWKPAAGFIDIDPRKVGRMLQGRPVVSADHLPAREAAVIVSYVGTRGARDVIRHWLTNAGRIEGLDFWIAA